MASSLTTKIAGLFTSVNDLSDAPEGALVRADNVVIRNRNIVEPRRGQTPQSYTFGVSTSRAYEIYFFDNTRIIHYLSGSDLVDTLARDTGAAWSDYSGTFYSFDISNLRMRGVEARQSIFFNPSQGIKVLDSAAGTIRSAGVKQPDTLNVRSATLSTSNTWLATLASVSYKVVWGRKDANGNVILSAPSGRSFIKNTAGAARSIAGLAIKLPTGETADFTYFWRLYRSESVTTDIPADDVYLVKEGRGVTSGTMAIGTMSKAGSSSNVTVTKAGHGFAANDLVTVTASGETNFTAGTFTVASVTANTFVYSDGSATTPGDKLNVAQQTYTYYGATAITDITPDALLGPPLYTNDSDGEGAIQANHQPPNCLDMAWWAERMWFGNTVSKHRFILRLLGTNAAATAGDNGIQNNDTVTIGGQAYTGKTGALSATSDFTIPALSASVSASVALEQCAINLVNAINGTSTTIRAFYLSAANGAPGEILLEEADIGAAAFTVFASRQASWSPGLTNSSTNALTSSNDTAVNRLFFSKHQQPHAVPLLNYLDVGAKNKEIQRIVPLRESLLVFKDDGLFVVTGVNTFRITQIDAGFRLAGANTAVEMDGKVYALSTKGPVAISDVGVSLIGGPLENVFFDTFTQYTASTTRTYAYGAAYESENSYILYLPTDSAATSFVAYVFNALTRTWVKWTTSRLCAKVSPRINGSSSVAKDLFYSGDVDSNAVYVERKTVTRDDYYDKALSYTVSALSADSLTVTVSSVSGLSVGDAISTSQAGTAYVPITAINGLTVTAAAALTYTNGQTAGFRTSYESLVVWLPKNPGHNLKHNRSADVLFKTRLFWAPQAQFYTDLSSSAENVSLVFSDRTSADSTTNISTYKLSNKKVLVPRDKQISAYLHVGFRCREALSFWRLNGYVLDYEDVSERGNR